MAPALSNLCEYSNSRSSVGIDTDPLLDRLPEDEMLYIEELPAAAERVEVRHREHGPAAVELQRGTTRSQRHQSAERHTGPLRDPPAGLGLHPLECDRPLQERAELRYDDPRRFGSLLLLLS